jgi:hypothetical protein
MCFGSNIVVITGQVVGIASLGKAILAENTSVNDAMHCINRAIFARKVMLTSQV